MNEEDVDSLKLKAKCPEMNDETYTNDLETKEIMRESVTEYELPLNVACNGQELKSVCCGFPWCLLL